jgi:hypothetical protein
MKYSLTRALLVVALSITSVSAQIQTPYIKGSARPTASKPYTSYTVQLHDISSQNIQRQSLDTDGRFIWLDVKPASYLVELLDAKGRVICTEGPIDVRKSPYHDIAIRCGSPAAWWLLTAAGAAGVTAGIVALAPASPSR